MSPAWYVAARIARGPKRAPGRWLTPSSKRRTEDGHIRAPRGQRGGIGHHGSFWKVVLPR